MNSRTALGALLASLVVAACSSPPPATQPAPPVCASAAPAPVVTAAPAPARVVSVDDVVRDLVAAYNARDPRRSFALMSTAMQTALPLDKEPAWIDGMLSKGALSDARRVGGDGPAHGVYEVKAERGAFRFEVHVDADGKIGGLQVKELVVPPAVVQSTLPLALPFKGEWLVLWGGDTPALNAHVGNASQRRAADLVKVDAEGKDRKGDGKKNSDFFCFGAEILAAADGTVISAVDGVPDNEPGQMNAYFVPGNSLVIAHEGGVHSMYGHLQLHSLKVREGAKVKRGTLLGLCGNSGNSSQPHLHFQLQDGARMESSWGVEAVFPEIRLTRDGKTTKAKGYTFLKNDRIELSR
ncbi:MAG TPA: M23 family metallopeptidase [Labilithrix sp.]|nr:M23 family metallopeptidase [Labilithrix sp.]